MYVFLEEDESDALLKLCRKERRHPRDQAALAIRADLERRGLLPKAPESEAPVPTQEAT